MKVTFSCTFQCPCDKSGTNAHMPLNEFKMVKLEKGRKWIFRFEKGLKLIFKYDFKIGKYCLQTDYPLKKPLKKIIKTPYPLVKSH